MSRNNEVLDIISADYFTVRELENWRSEMFLGRLEDSTISPASIQPEIDERRVARDIELVKDTSFTDAQITEVVHAVLHKENLSGEVSRSMRALRKNASQIDGRGFLEKYMALINEIFKRLKGYIPQASSDTELTTDMAKVAAMEFLLQEYNYMSSSPSNCKARIFSIIKDSLEREAKALKHVLSEQPNLDDTLKKVKNQAEFLLKPRFLSNGKKWMFWDTRFSQVLGNSLGKMATSSGSLTAVLSGSASIQVGIYYAYNNLPVPAVINIGVGSILIGSQLCRAAKAAFEGNYEIL